MKALIFDWETSGIPLHPSAKLELQPRAIEFGGVVIDRAGTILREESFLIYPDLQIEPVITKVTGLTNADLAGQPLFAHFFPILEEVFASVDVMIAHNLPFDKSILHYELQRLGFPPFTWPKGECCTVQLFVEEFGYRPKLPELFEHVTGRKLEQTHRAVEDARALAEIVIKENLLDMFD